MQSELIELKSKAKVIGRRSIHVPLLNESREPGQGEPRRSGNHARARRPPGPEEVKSCWYEWVTQRM
jgi:hypothetical protein